MVERGTGVAVWRQIGEQLAQDVRGHLYAPGERLPSEPELAAKFSVNRHTIRRAMSELEQLGLVRIEQGRGTFVQEHPIDYAIGLRTRFSENLSNQGMRGHFEVIGCQSLRAADAARHLELARNAPLLRIQTLGKAKDRCINFSDHYVDENRFPDFAERLRTLRSISRAYAHYGVTDYTRKWSRITAMLPTPDIAQRLGQPKTRPILQVEALNLDSEGSPLQYSLTRFSGDSVQLVIENETV